MDSHREHLLSVVLTDDIVVEDLADLHRGRNFVARFRQRRLVLLGDDIQAKLDTLVTNENGRPGNEFAHLVLALAAERAVERVLRIVAANFAHFRAALRDATVLRAFRVALIKPSHYDDDGYVIQWWRSFIPSPRLPDRHTGVDRARYRDHQKGAAGRYPRILLPHAASGLGGS